MQDYRLTVDETRSINQAMEGKMQQFDNMITEVGKMVSRMTNLPAYAVARGPASVTVTVRTSRSAAFARRRNTSDTAA